MANRKVILLRYCKTEKGWRRYPVAIGGNGRIRPNYVLVDGKPVEYKDGHYEIRYYEGDKPKYKNVGTDAQDALGARDREAQLLIARDAAVAGGAVLVEDPERIQLSTEAKKFVQAAEDRHAVVVAGAYRLAIDEFLATSGRRYSDQVTREDVTGHLTALRKRGCSDRTVFNRHRLVKSFLQYCKLPKETFKGTRPPFEKKKPEIYEAAQLKAFFASLTDPYHLLIFNLLLKTGLREQEAMYLEWDDISTAASTLTLHSKPHLGFKIKDKEERSVPVASGLLKMMKAYRKANPTKHFVIGNTKDRPHTKLLRLLKGLVRDAGLNCGRCEGCKDRQECEKWFLHKFRSTYCTKLLRSGLDVATVQKMMGHSDLESTMRYLKPEEDAHTQSKINSIQWT